VTAAALAAAVVLGVAGGAQTFPPIAVDGIGGVRPDMTLRAVRAHWHVPLRASVDENGSQSRAEAAVCVGDVEGVTYFTGASGFRPLDTHLFFQSAVFTAGARTDTGVGIGSSVADVRKAYGSRLRGTRSELRLISAKTPRTTILFELESQRVKAIAFGRRGSVHATLFVPAC